MEHELDGGYILRITRYDAPIIGPLRFINVSNSACDCPWGVWVLYKGNSCFMDVQTISMKDAVDAYYAARTFTHNYSSHNLKVAKMLHYYTDDKTINELKEQAYAMIPVAPLEPCAAASL